MLEDSITDMVSACKRYKVATKTLTDQFPDGIPPDMPYASRKKAFTFYLDKLVKECEDLIPFFDRATKCLEEQSQLVCSTLSKQYQRETGLTDAVQTGIGDQGHSFPTFIFNEECVVMAAKDAGIKCRQAMIDLVSDIRDLRCAGLPFQMVIQSVVGILKDYDDVASFKCKTVTFLLKITTTTAWDVVDIQHFRREEQLERTLYQQTEPGDHLPSVNFMLGGSSDRIGEGLTNMAHACERFEAARRALCQEPPIRGRPGLAYTSRGKALSFYLGLLFQECKDLIPLFDKATKDLKKQGHLIRRHHPLNMPQPTFIIDEKNFVMCTIRASQLCQQAMINLQHHIRHLRTYSHMYIIPGISPPIETFIQTAVGIFKEYDNVTFFKCEILTLLLDFIAEIDRDMLDIKRRGKEQLERELYEATKPNQNP